MAELMACRQKYVDVTGDALLEKEEVTDAQLSCLKAKLDLGQPPFIDVWFGVPTATAWRDRCSRMLKDGQWKAAELPGGSIVQGWEERWRIFGNYGNPSIATYYPKQPWNSVIKTSDSCTEFWGNEFERGVLRCQCNGPKPMPASYEAPPSVGAGTPRGEKRSTICNARMADI